MTTSFSGRRDLVIINRSFWPIYPVIGEALLRFAEEQSSRYHVSVIMQDHADIRRQLQQENRGAGVEFFPGRAWSDSSSGVMLRALDAVFFMCWVFFTLLRTRPRTVYVSTDPPVLVPFIVMIYAALFRARYVYHLQDIHPEAANVVMRVSPWMVSLLRLLDSITMRRADQIITITDEMADVIRERSGTIAPIHVVSNPAVSFDDVEYPDGKIEGFSFCGNAGRLQRMPLLMTSIERYLQLGGKLKFCFAGGGVYAQDIQALADKFAEVEYFGRVTATQAAQLNAEYEWALLPIEDEVTKYAFPSKSSSYIFSGAAVLAVCGESTSVALWVQKHGVGIVAPPQVEGLVGIFRDIESGQLRASSYSGDRSGLKKALEFDQFLVRLERIVPLQVS